MLRAKRLASSLLNILGVHLLLISQSYCPTLSTEDFWMVATSRTWVLSAKPRVVPELRLWPCMVATSSTSDQIIKLCTTVLATFGKNGKCRSRFPWYMSHPHPSWIGDIHVNIHKFDTWTGCHRMARPTLHISLPFECYITLNADAAPRQDPA